MATESIYLALAVALLGWTLYGVVWRLYLSPLAKFPGPTLAALIGVWYEFYYNVVKDGQFIWEIEKMHEVYGPIVRISTFELHIIDPDYYDEVYAGFTKRRNKYPWFYTAAGSPLSTFQTTEHDHHRVRRSALNQFFSKKTITELEPILTGEIENLSAIFESHVRKAAPVDLRLLWISLTLDIISHYCFGESEGCLPDQKKGELWRITLTDAFAKGNLIPHFPWLVDLINILPVSVAGYFIPQVKHRYHVRQHVSAILRGDPGTEKNTNTIYRELRDSSLPQIEKTVSRLTDEGNVLIEAGAETTAATLAVLSFHLLDNPDMLAKLRVELDNVYIEPDTKVTWKQLEKLPYLTGAIKEALRLANPVCPRLPRVAPNEELQYGDWTIPAGTPVGMCYYFIHYNSEIFPEPFKFDPERWTKAAEDGVRLDKYLVPFSKGTRGCVGLNLAWAELYLATATVFRRFDMELYETSRNDVDIARDCFASQPVKGSKGVRVIVTGLRK